MDSNGDFRQSWEQGYGVITHSEETRNRIHAMIEYLKAENLLTPNADPYQFLWAADRIASYGMWLVVHMTYAGHVYLDGRELTSGDFKKYPEGHTGGALNMVPGYTGYMLINALMGKTRGWVMGQGHAVAAIHALNLILDNMTPEHQARYGMTEEGLTRFVNDFYSYSLNERGQQDSPIGSHVNPLTGGGIMESGYLGFTEVQYAHMPLPGERLVAFLSDGAFEEQRGSDWTPRWWREEDSGLISPIMIANGRRIDQQSTMSMSGGADWLVKYLKLHHFDPIQIDGRDPAAFAWVIFESERRLKHESKGIETITAYDVPVPYGIAIAPKGAGFFNEGTNYAHNLPLVTNPYLDHVAANRFNTHAAKLHVPIEEITRAIATINNHDKTERKKEKDNPLATRNVQAPAIPDLDYQNVFRSQTRAFSQSRPMTAIDHSFLKIIKTNPDLRPRVGNPDEMKSNRMIETLEELHFRVTHPEGGINESVFGKVITALNEEAIAGAAFGNKGGINIIVTYEAFGAKIFGEARQEVIYAKHQKEVGRPAGWLSVPLVLTSHTWENGKNELSHQDPSLAESMLGETSDVSRVFFPADYNHCTALMENIYKTKGEIWTIVVSKRNTPNWFTKEESLAMVRDGGGKLNWTGHKPDEAALLLVAAGTYQLKEILKASVRLKERDIPHRVAYILEPGKFRIPRNTGECAHQAPPQIIEEIFPEKTKQVILVTHTRPEPVLGAIRNICSNRRVRALGFINEGGTLDADGMLFVNKCSWAHLLAESASLLSLDREKLLSAEEIAALDGKKSPDGIIRSPGFNE